MSEKIPLLVIVGPTASGKTALGAEIALRYSGEVISADSMQIYKGMDIASAKPTPDEMCGVPHHLMSFAEPGESFSVADYTALAHKVIGDIYDRGKLPVMVGGTGLYISSVLDNLKFSPAESDEAYREELKKLAKEKGGAFLLDMLSAIDPESARKLHVNDEKRIIRALEIYRATGKTMSHQISESRSEPSPYNALIIGLNTADRSVLYSRINARVDDMIERGLVEEAREYYDPNAPTSSQAIGHKELVPYFNGNMTLSQALDNLKMQTRRYAKRQISWFKRVDSVNWIYTDEQGSFENVVAEAVRIIENSGVID